MYLTSEYSSFRSTLFYPNNTRSYRNLEILREGNQKWWCQTSYGHGHSEVGFQGFQETPSPYKHSLLPWRGGILWLKGFVPWRGTWRLKSVRLHGFRVGHFKNLAAFMFIQFSCRQLNKAMDLLPCGTTSMNFIQKSGWRNSWSIWVSVNNTREASQIWARWRSTTKRPSHSLPSLPTQDSLPAEYANINTTEWRILWKRKPLFRCWE